MYTSLQEICQELKRMGSHRGDASGVSSRHQSVSEGIDNRADRAPVLGLSKRHGTLNYASYLRENGPHQPNRRAKSAPKTRVNRDAGFTKENSVYVQDPYGSSRYSPNEVLFEETVQMERIYLRKFVAALIKYDDDRYDSELEQDGRSLRDVVERLLPHANFAKDWHFKYGIEAWVSRIAFREFGKSEGTASDSANLWEPLVTRLERLICTFLTWLMPRASLSFTPLLLLVYPKCTLFYSGCILILERCLHVLAGR